jgi:hypothetical protein
MTKLNRRIIVIEGRINIITSKFIVNVWWLPTHKKIILKVLVVMWRSEISDCVLSPQAYLH